MNLDSLIQTKLQEFSFLNEQAEKTIISAIAPLQKCVIGVHDVSKPGIESVRVAIPDNMNDSCTYIEKKVGEVISKKLHWRIFFPYFESSNETIITLSSWTCWPAPDSYPEGYHDSFSKALKQVKQFYAQGEKIYLDFFTCKSDITILYNDSKHSSNRSLKAAQYKLTNIAGSKWLTGKELILKGKDLTLPDEPESKRYNFSLYETESRYFKKDFLKFVRG